MIVLDIQRMSTEDGPGLRTTLFVKGCPLSCKWCHNPESISYKMQNEWIKVRCIGCLSCIKVCPNNALTMTPNGLIIDRQKCTVCKKCIDACPTGALETKGENKIVDGLYKELIKDKAYWGEDGGVTISGGEVLSQSKEAALLLAKLKADGVHTAIDTSGFCSRADIDKVLAYTDLFLYDLKIYDSAKHAQYTGQDNKVIIDNFNYLVEQTQRTGKKIWVRTPIIPNATDDEDNIMGIAKLVKGRVEKWELCTFNNLCRDKYERLYLDWDYKDAPLITKQKMLDLQAVARSMGVENVCWTGATK